LPGPGVAVVPRDAAGAPAAGAAGRARPGGPRRGRSAAAAGPDAAGPGRAAVLRRLAAGRRAVPARHRPVVRAGERRGARPLPRLVHHLGPDRDDLLVL